MPDFVPTEHCVQVSVIGTHSSGKQLFNVLHFRASNALPDAADVAACVAQVAAWCHDFYQVVFHNSITITEIRGRSMAEEPAPETVDFVTEVGDVTGDQGALSSSCVVETLTGYTGPSRRGLFWSFVPGEISQATGLWDVAYVAALVLALTNLKNDAAANGYPWSVWSRHTRDVYPITGVIGSRIPRDLSSRAVDHGI